MQEILPNSLTRGPRLSPHRQSMPSRRDIERIERIERDRLTLSVLRLLAGGQTPYGRVRAEFERLPGPRPVPFDDLIQAMISDKLIDYESGPGAGTESIALWLRPWGEARLRESGQSL